MFDPEDENIAREVRFETFSAGGPGGQHANRTSSAVRAVHIPTGITAISRESRSQYQNKKIALERLLLKLKERRRSAKPRLRCVTPAWVRLKRLEEKKRLSQKKRLRQKVETS